jgi:uncharacterized membrane protein
MRRWLVPLLAVALLLSLTANFVGAGYALKTWRAEAAAMSFVTGALGGYSPPLRKAMRAAFVADRRALLAALRDLRDARRAMRAALEARPFDAGAAEAAMQAVDARTTALQQRVHAAMLAAAKATP